MELKIIRDTVKCVLNGIYEHDNMNDFEKGFNLATKQVAMEFARTFCLKMEDTKL